ncbi:SpoIIE family protein phosphatase [Cryptosporangium japonicum]|uniref:Sigma-F factor regulator n=1 Tax=Cryptosporangium japonicum TaxID=80872 RepID=A0ABP3DBF4_9ACTN
MVAANAAFRAFVGDEHVVGRAYSEVFPGFAAQQISPMVQRIYATGEPQTGRGWRFQVDSDGTSPAREFFLDFVIEPYREADGTIVGVSGIAIDVTEQVRRREADQQHAAEAEHRYAQARDVITDLQRRLLPPGLPVLPAVRVAGSYLLADTEDAAGGDWFDAIPLPDGRVALVVGDVVGHGVAASAAMGQLRAVIHDRLDETGDLLAAIRAADRMARRVPEAHAATVCIAALDPADGTLTYCSAAHPPPLIVSADTARFLPPSGARPLGTGAGYDVAADHLDVDDVVLLYTDGIVERPGRNPAAATVELSQVAVDAVAGRGFHGPLPAIDRACTQTLELLVRQTGHTDDITLLAAQRRTPPAPFECTRPADHDTIRAVRHALDAWLHDHDTGENDRFLLAHAIGELVTNAAEHSRPDTVGGTVTVTAELGDDAVVTVRVADDGQWRDRPRTAEPGSRLSGGLGLAMTAELVDDLDLHRGPDGTTATVHHRLTRPARLLTTEEIHHGVPAHPSEPVSDLLLVLDQPQAPASRIAVHGPLDATTAPQFAAELTRRTLGGTHPLTVDLTAVTHLASSAVAVLARRHDTALSLYAPAGSLAHHVLSLVALPHVTEDPHFG